MEVIVKAGNMILNITEKLIEIMSWFLAVLTLIAIIKFLELFSSVITLGLVALLTSLTFGTRRLLIMSVGGIILYMLAWPTTWVYGPLYGISVWNAGMLLWFTAVYEGFNESVVQTLVRVPQLMWR